LNNVFPFIIVLKLLYKELLNIKGIIFLVSTILVLSSLMLLKNYQVFFENYYISYLKSIYPHNFSEMKNIKNIDIKNISYADEIYEVSLKDIKLFFFKDSIWERVNIKSLGVRSFSPNHIPEIIKNIYQEDTIFISHKLYDKIISSKNFHQQISFNSHKHRFNIKSFNTHLENDYILLSNDIAKKIFSLSKFNIVNIYSPYNDTYIYQKFKRHNIGVINWKDRLPFFNKLFFGIYEKISIIYIFVFSALVIIFMIFFLSSLLEDISKALKQIIYSGNSFFYAFLIVFFVVILFSLMIFYSSYFSFYIFNDFLINSILKDFKINNMMNFNLELVYLLFIVSAFSFFWTLYYKIKRDNP